MRAIRFHGRGGQGAKTASRIVGTAAFLEGYTAQDSPIYGAERRGAPVVAFTRIARGPIRERGVILQPNLVVIADESLLADPTARAMEGVTDDTTVFVNTSRTAAQLCKETSVPGRLSTLDVTDQVLKEFGHARALSAALGAITGRLLGLKAESIQTAIARELAELGLTAPVIEQNQKVAAHCYESVEVVPVGEVSREPTASTALWSPVYEPPTRGTARITAGANAPLRKTGTWRTFRPVLIPDKCNGCWLCFAYCPDAAIKIDADDRPVIDYDYCKGCLACVEECPTHALLAVRETEKAPT